MPDPCAIVLVLVLVLARSGDEFFPEGHPQRGSVWQEGPRAAVHVCDVAPYRFKVASFFFFGVSHDRPYVPDWFHTVGGGHLPIPKKGKKGMGPDAADGGDPAAGAPRAATDRVRYYFPVMAARHKLVPATPDGATFVSLSSTVWDVVPQVCAGGGFGPLR